MKQQFLDLKGLTELVSYLKDWLIIQSVEKKHLPDNGMLPSYRTMKYKSPIWGYFHVQKE